MATKKNSADGRKAALVSTLVTGATQARSEAQGEGSFARRLSLADSLQAGPNHPVKRLRLEAILDRDTDIRPLDQRHVIDLARSIAAVGLLQFPVVDEGNRLLAGGHRRAAVAVLQQIQDAPEEEVRALFDTDDDKLTPDELAHLKGSFRRLFAEGVLVHVFDTTGLEDKDIRLKVEAIENEKRRDFTKQDIAHIVERLREAGYRDVVGRPKEGERVLSAELARIMGKSRASVFRHLKELREPGDTKSSRPGKSDTSRALATQLSEHLGTKVTVRDGEGQGGAITLHYTSYKQRKDLLRQLGLEV